MISTTFTDGEQTTTEQTRRRTRQHELSNIIKSTHNEIRSEGWESATTGQAESRLTAYAEAMHELAEQHWGDHEPSSDRLGLTLGIVKEYYCEGGLRQLLSKPLRRTYYSDHNAVPCEDVISQMLRSEFGEDFSDTTTSASSLSLLDVGSCYDPFRDHPMTKELGLNVTAVDLAPSPKAPSVITVDWLDVSAAAPFCHRQYDVVVLCLVLSYIPTPQLRLTAVVHALEAVKRFGLIVVVCTRTQGPRDGRWIREWEDVFLRLGCRRFRCETRKNLVMMAYSMIDNVRAKMLSLDGEELVSLSSKLVITADVKNAKRSRE